MCADYICILRCFCRNKGETSFVTSLQDLDFVEVSKKTWRLLCWQQPMHFCMNVLFLYDLLDGKKTFCVTFIACVEE